MGVATAKKPLKTRTRVGAGGRIVIPAQIRRELGMEEGEPVVMRVENGELRIWTIDEGIRRAQAIASKYVVPGKSMADELIAERRAEVAREEQELREWQAARSAESGDE